MTGTRDVGSPPRGWKADHRGLAYESSMASSMLTSMTWARSRPAGARDGDACSNSPARIIRAKAFEPVTLVRSPMLTNSDRSSIVSGLRPGELHRRRRQRRGRGAVRSLARVACWRGCGPHRARVRVG